MRGSSLIRPRYALITGCPRSGTTALLEWLAARSDTTAANETRTLIATHRFMEQVDRFVSLQRERRPLVRRLRAVIDGSANHAVQARLRVEKEPLEPIALPAGDYAEFLRHARELLPRLRIVYMLRHPVETIWSMLNRQWGYTLTSGELRSYSLDECIDIWRTNAALAESLRTDRRVLLCRFEQLVSAPATESRRILRFLRLPAGPAFQPKPVKTVRFSVGDEQRILDATRSERSFLGY